MKCPNLLVFRHRNDLSSVLRTLTDHNLDVSFNDVLGPRASMLRHIKNKSRYRELRRSCAAKKARHAVCIVARV